MTTAGDATESYCSTGDVGGFPRPALVLISLPGLNRIGVLAEKPGDFAVVFSRIAQPAAGPVRQPLEFVSGLRGEMPVHRQGDGRMVSVTVPTVDLPRP
jgi:hypothetical protein